VESSLYWDHLGPRVVVKCFMNSSRTQGR